MNPRATGLLLLVAAALGAFVYFYEIRGEPQRREAAERAKRLFPDLEASDVQWVVLPTRQGPIARVQRDDGGWKLTKPLEFPADAVSLDGVASELASIARERALEQAQAPEVYGLGKDARVIRFGGPKGEHELRIGHKAPLGGNTYVAVDKDPRVFLVPTFHVNAFDRRLDDLRDRRPIVFDRERVSRIELSWPDGGVVLEKKDGGWRMLEPLETRADESTIERLLSDLAFLRATGFVDTPVSDADAGLAPPAFRALLLGPLPKKKGAERARWEVAIGSSIDGQSCLVRGREEKTLYRIPKQRLDDFPRKVVAYRFKQLSRFVLSDARRLELVFASPKGEPLREVAERVKDTWKAHPEPMPGEKITGILSELASLDAQDIAAESMGERELAGVGLAPPHAKLRVFGAAPKGGGEAPKLAEVWLGKSDPKRGIFARVPDRDTVYLIRYDLGQSLPLGLEAFRNRFVEKKATKKAGAKAGGAEGEKKGAAGSGASGPGS